MRSALLASVWLMSASCFAGTIFNEIDKPPVVPPGTGYVPACSRIIPGNVPAITKSGPKGEELCIVDISYESEVKPGDHEVKSDEIFTYYKSRAQTVIFMDYDQMVEASNRLKVEGIEVPGHAFAGVAVALGMGAARCAANIACRSAVISGAKWFANAVGTGTIGYFVGTTLDRLITKP